MADYSDGTWTIPVSKVLKALHDREPTEEGKDALRHAMEDMEDLRRLRALVSGEHQSEWSVRVHEGTWKKLVNGTF